MSKKSKMKCPRCESAAIHEVRSTQTLKRSGELVRYDEIASQCQECELTFLTREQSLEASRSAATAMRSRSGFLGPVDIRTLREGLGVSQADMERVLGVGPKTFGRWERGTVCQSGAADSLLRAFQRSPGLFENLAVARGIQLAKPEGSFDLPTTGLRSTVGVSVVTAATGEWTVIEIDS